MPGLGLSQSSRRKEETQQRGARSVIPRVIETLIVSLTNN
jgi:hypothetical protein